MEDYAQTDSDDAPESHGEYSIYLENLSLQMHDDLDEIEDMLLRIEDQLAQPPKVAPLNLVCCYQSQGPCCLKTRADRISVKTGQEAATGPLRRAAAATPPASFWPRRQALLSVRGH